MSSSGSVLELILVSPGGIPRKSVGDPGWRSCQQGGGKLTQCTHVYRVGIIAATSLKSPVGREVICLETRGEGETASGVRRTTH